MTTPDILKARARRRLQNVAIVLITMQAGSTILSADLITNLQRLPERIKVGDPGIVAEDLKEGPKGIATADFNGDGRPDFVVGNLDGTITVVMNRSTAAEVKFAPPLHLQTGAQELRSVLAADLNGDGKPDLAAASPLDGRVIVYFNEGGGTFRLKTPPLQGWLGVRCLAAGDFDGDGTTDLAAAGTGVGVRHFRGTGGGEFEIMGDLVRLSPRNPNLTETRPVYAMHPLRSRDGLRDDLLVTHAETPCLWILSTAPADYSAEPPVNPAALPAWKANPSPVLLHEVQVHNAGTLADADGTNPSWVELLNKSNSPVNLSGWKLRLLTAEWPFPSVTIEPGRFLIVFLSGKNRNTPSDLHTDERLVLKQSTDALNLVQPDGTIANTIDLEKHTIAGVSRGLAPDSDSVKWFDIPSPRAENNAGHGGLENLVEEATATLDITPRDPAPGQPVTVRVEVPAKPTGGTFVRTVWFAAAPGLTEHYHPMHRISLPGVSPEVYQELFPPGVFTGVAPHRVLARLRDEGTSNDFTVELNRGLDAVQDTEVVQPGAGCLRPVASVPSPKVKAFDTGPVTTPAGSPNAPADLVYADDEGGQLRVHRAGPGIRRFETIPSQFVPLRGKPRDVKLADTNNDGWLDAVTVLYAANLAINCRNVDGTLGAAGQVPTGESPRELVMADFTGDGRPDAAVINRLSSDVSILPSADNASGLVNSDQIYQVDGEVAALIVRDFSIPPDGHDDVLQLHRASGEISIRYAATDGKLGPPVFRTLGAYGSSAVALDYINNDTRLDVVSANLGQGLEGSISVLLGKEDGSFEAPRVFPAGGALYSLAIADFNRDGHNDVMAGLYDCTAELFFGTGTGDFALDSYDVPMSLINEARFLVASDFDDDGDIDVAGAGYEGDMVVMENKGAATGGNWQDSWARHWYPAPSNLNYAAERIAVTMVNDDGDEDLIIGTGHGVILYTGNGVKDIGFTPQPLYSEDTGIHFAISDVLAADLTGDDVPDMVEACRYAACINILEKTQDGRFVTVMQVDVPSGRFLATGYLDGDDEPDLVGSGDALWTVLSSRPSVVAPPDTSVINRPAIPQVVINEILARNTGITVASDNFRNSDFIELFNGTGMPVNLSGWKIRVQSNQEGLPVDKSWTLPATGIPANGHTVIVCALHESDPPPPESTRTGFVLPAEGGTITLLQPDNSVAGDPVEYPHAGENVSWARFQDGHTSFCANPVPSPGKGNLDNGPVPPEVTLVPPRPSDLESGPLRFIARSNDDLAIISMSLVWNRLDFPLPQPMRTVLYDNGPGPGGLRPDTAAQDGLFTGDMELFPGVPLPTGAEVQYYLEAVDISGQVIRLPEDAKLTTAPEVPVAWTFSLKPPLTLEIVEVCTDNVALTRDENGGNPDYVRVRNTGSEVVNLSSILLAKSPQASRIEAYGLPSGLSLPPGGEITVFADANPDEGPLHAPFTLDSGGDDLALLELKPSGARQWIQSLTIPELAPDIRFLRLPGTDYFAEVGPAADMNNWIGTVWNVTDNSVFVAARFLAAAGTSYRIEGDARDEPEEWTLLETITGDGAVHTLVRPRESMAALRIIPDTGVSPPHVDVLPGVTTAGICGKAPGASRVALFYGLADAGTGAAAWPHSMLSTGADFAFTPPLVPDTRYHFRLRATTTAGEIWSGAAASFQTLSPGTPEVSALVLTKLNPVNAAVEFRIDPPLPPGHAVTVLAGNEDAFGQVDAWDSGKPAALSTTTGRWTAPLNGLARETGYFVRVSIPGVSVSAQRLTFRTPNTAENLMQNLRLSEIMYNPAWPTVGEAAAGYEREDFEYIELQNTSTEPMSLTGLWFDGIGFDFPPSGAPVLPPGGFAVIASHPHAFALRYGSTIPLAGWLLHPFRNSRLANDGEDLTLRTSDGRVIFTLPYRDDILLADNGGYSLEYHQNTGALRDEAPGDYFAGLYYGGSPGYRPDLPSAVTYNSWKSGRFTIAQLNSPVSAMEADADHDGLSNFFEYACGTHPLIPDSPDVLTPGEHPASGESIAGIYSLDFPANLEAVEAVRVIESTATGFDTWTPVGVWGYEDLYPFYHEPWLTNWKQVRITAPVVGSGPPPGSGPRMFYRLKIIKR